MPGPDDDEATINGNDPLARHVREVLKELGEDPDREGLERTPARVAKAFRYLTSGYQKNAHEVLNEAQALHEVSARAEVYPADFRARVRGDVDAYVTFVVDTEWAYMRDKGEISPRGTELLAKLRQDVASRVPQSDLEAQVYQPIMDRIAAADESRTTRGQSTGPTMPGVVWFGLIVGAVVTVGMIFALQIRRSPRASRSSPRSCTRSTGPSPRSLCRTCAARSRRRRTRSPG